MLYSTIAYTYYDIRKPRLILHSIARRGAAQPRFSENTETGSF